MLYSVGLHQVIRNSQKIKVLFFIREKYPFSKKEGGIGLHQVLRKSSTDKSIMGVCGGIAEYFGISSFAVRLILILLSPANLLIYIILASTMSESPKSLY